MSLACHKHKRFSAICAACRANAVNGSVLSLELQQEIALLRAKALRYESVLQLIEEEVCDSGCYWSASDALDAFGVERDG